MARVISSDTIRPVYKGRGVGISVEEKGERFDLTEMGALWVYNGLDCCTTFEVNEELTKLENANSKRSYNFNMALYGPALSMMLRGTLVDYVFRDELLGSLYERMNKLQELLKKYAVAIWGRELNLNSPDQMKAFFYIWPGRPDKFPPGLGLSPKYNKVKGKNAVMTADHKALERCRNESLIATPIVNVIFAWKDLKTLVKVLESGIDPDGRMRFSFNVGATETDRWSSSKNCFDLGTNGQNVTPEVRELFIADDGWKMGYLDLDQAESYVVGYVSEDLNYINACTSGDLHTTVAKIIWPDLEWTGDLTHDRYVVAAQSFYRHFSYRDMAKRCGHATNYKGKAFALARTLGIPQHTAEQFIAVYLEEKFPGIDNWHADIAETLQTTGTLVTPFGFTRTFFGRLNDERTLKEAIAFVPQSTVSNYLNVGLYRCWKELELELGLIKVLTQQHDAFQFLYRVSDEDFVLKRAKELMEFPLNIKGRDMVIPTGAEVGWNWKNLHKPGSKKEIEATRAHLAKLDERAANPKSRIDSLLQMRV